MRRMTSARDRPRSSKADAFLIELDELDRKATAAFPGHMVRKDLVRQFRGQFPVPTYVVEFMLGRYCASTDPAEIEEGVEMVSEQLTARTVRAGEEELFKARARERGSVRMIDIITAGLDARTDSYLATLPSLRLNDVRIADRLVNEHERMLTGGSIPRSTWAMTRRSRRKKPDGRLKYCRFGKSSSRLATSWTRSPKGGGR
jgi:predicted ATP-dependent Lon-type protease